MTLISPEMRAAVGTQISRRVSDRISAGDVRRWAIAVYWPEPAPGEFLLDDERQRVPEEFNPFAWHVARTETHPEAANVDKIDPDRTEKQLGLAGPGLRFQLNGGLQAEYDARMRVGDVITSVIRLGDYSEREGKHGPMLISVSTDTWTNQHGAQIKRVDTTLIRY